jgi:hypothetical protein
MKKEEEPASEDGETEPIDAPHPSTTLLAKVWSSPPGTCMKFRHKKNKKIKK